MGVSRPLSAKFQIHREVKVNCICLSYHCGSAAAATLGPDIVPQNQKMEGKQRKMRIFSMDDLVLQRKLGQCWIVRKGRVYNVTEFANDHPGGDELITQFAGMDIGAAMEDEDEHMHSESAYAMLEEYLVGRLGNDTVTVSEGLSVGRPVMQMLI